MASVQAARSALRVELLVFAFLSLHGNAEMQRSSTSCSSSDDEHCEEKRHALTSARMDDAETVLPEVNLLQYTLAVEDGSETDIQAMGVESETPTHRQEYERESRKFIWSTGPFLDCCGKATEEGKFYSYREITCVNRMTAEEVDAAQCVGPYPGNYQEGCPCNAADNACRDDEEVCGHHARNADFTNGSLSDYAKLGCFEAVTPEPLLLPEHNERKDYACMNFSGEGKCAYGLPFYHVKHGSDFGHAACARYCFSKSLDIFGLFAEQGVCRCGSSRLNEDIWRHETAGRGFLNFDVEALTEASGDACPLKVFMYDGAFVSGTLPQRLTMETLQSAEYIDSIVTGKREQQSNEESLTQMGTEHYLDTERYLAAPKWDRPCWPGNCGAGKGPWKTRTSTSPVPGQGGSGDWEEYVTIDFMFEDTAAKKSPEAEAIVDNGRKEVFRRAVKEWRTHTCINLMEKPNCDASRYCARVGVFAKASCYVMGMGQPGNWDKNQGYPRINLGFCNTMRNLGNVVHEIGHLLGMNHEQKRADAAQSYLGKPAHLKMHWENIPSRWEPQWRPDMESYVGSSDQGAGDVEHGYSPYDFGSIMHYPLGDNADTIPANAANTFRIGQRKALTEGDIEQINDIYQCKCKGSSCGSQLKYWVSALGSTTCRNGYSIITDERECQSAAGGKFDKAEVDASYPAGCYQYKGGKFYFNKHSLGRRHADASVACAKAEAQARTTREGCACHRSWTVQGRQITDYCARHSTGEWCIVVDKNCEGQDWGYCAPQA